MWATPALGLAVPWSTLPNAHGSTQAEFGGAVAMAGGPGIERVSTPAGAAIDVDDHGKPMAPTGINGKLTVFNGTQKSEAELTVAVDQLEANGVKPNPGAKGVAERADTVFTMVPDAPDVEAVLFGENGDAQGLKPGKVVVDMSSISPIETKAFAKKINALGCEYLDAPVCGGEVGAKAASLTIMVGGSEGAVERVKPLFELMGKNITLVGGNGDGQTTKVANLYHSALVRALEILAAHEVAHG